MRLLLVWRAGPDGYRWIPPRERDEVIVAFDDLAATELQDRGALRFDDLQTWKDREEGERLVSTAFDQLRASSALAQLDVDGYSLADFIEHSVRVDFANVHRGWTAARAAPGCTTVVGDPSCPAALLIGAHAAADLGSPAREYSPAQSPTWQPSRPRRVAGQILVRGGAAMSPKRAVRVAAAANYKVTHALNATPPETLRSLGVAAMPLPGFDPRENLRAARRARLSVLRTINAPFSRPRFHFGDLDTLRISTGDASLDSGFEDVARRLAVIAWPQLAKAVSATRALDAERDLRSLLMPTLFSGTPRVFTAWAQRRGVRVAVLQHGVYAFRDFNGQDRGADVVLRWGRGVDDATAAWWDDAELVTVGAPGVGPPPASRTASRRVRRVLFASTGLSLESLLSPAALHDWFLAAVLPGAARLQEQGVSVALRLHPTEATGRYERLMRLTGTRIPFANQGSFADVAGEADLLVSAFSSVSLEASAMGMPVLMWLPKMPHDFRSTHLLPPWTGALPGVFHDTAGFLTLVDQLAGECPPAMRTGHELAEVLRGFAQPFDRQRFAEVLRDLSG